MKINRFDRLEFEILSYSSGGMYSMESKRKKRALILMVEEILKANPVEQWSNSGWKLTKSGEAYFKAFTKRLRSKHGHAWETNRDSNPDLYEEDDKYGKKINIFAYEVGYHNGMRCKNCGYSFCHHCDSEFDVPECSSRSDGKK